MNLNHFDEGYLYYCTNKAVDVSELQETTMF